MQRHGIAATKFKFAVVLREAKGLMNQWQA
jgi:hypothetical protein